MKTTFICLFLFISGAVAQAQDLSWSSNRPQNTLIEGCGAGQFTITNDGNTSVDITIELSGNYDEEDLTINLTSPTAIEANSSYSFTIEALADAETENDEFISIKILTENNVVLEQELKLADALTLETDLDDELTACPGEDVLLIAKSNAQITWLPNNVVNDSLLLPFRKSIDVTATANQGSCLETLDFTILPIVDVKINSTVDTLFLCAGDDPVNVSATPTNTTDITWSSEGFLFGQGPGMTVDINPISSGFLYATVTSENCTVTDTMFVRVDSLPDIVFDTIPSKDPYCPGELVTIYGMKLQQDRFPNAIYDWAPSTGVLSETNKANLTLTTTDTITFIRTTQNNACISRDSITLNVDNPPILLNFTDTTVCPNQTVEIELLNPELFKSYEWGPEEKVSCTECVKTKVSVAESSVITLNLETEHCPTSASVNVNITPPKSITIEGMSPVCPGEDVQLTAVDVAEYNSFSWEGNVSFSCTDCPNPIINSDEINSATLIATDANGCLGTGNFIYGVHNVPEVSIGIEPTDIAQGETVMATLLTDESEQFTEIVWKVNDKIIDQSEMTASLVMEGEENTIVVTALTENGCPVTATIIVDAEPPSYTIPNAFTPKASSNNIFRVVTKGNIIVTRMRIFSRWSQLIFTDESGEGWNGTQNGKPMPSDTYVYIIELTLPDGKKIEETSEVTLIN